MMNYRFDYGRSKGDPEKCVLPTILFVNTNHIAFNGDRRKGFLIVFGWWDYSIKTGIIF